MKRLPEFIAFIFVLLFFSVRMPSNRWNQVVHSDGKGYYAHLPAIFIYNDLTYAFADEIEKKYYPEDGSMSKHFRFTFKGEIVNKTFSGIAILWLPFFLLAHFLSLLLGFPTDGYSIIYQFSIGISAIFYCWLGCHALLKLLKEFGFSNWIAGFVLIAMVFGTNYYYYLIFDPSLTHTYNFTLITAFLLFTKRYFSNQVLSDFLVATGIFALILCVRPQNGFILLTVPFLALTPSAFKKTILHTISRLRSLIIAFVIFGAIISIPMILWYLQTGYFIVYSYGNERFVFSNPQFLNVLFSYKKGLFVYSPIILISLLGLIPLFKKSRFQLMTLCGFLVLNTYIISSWEEWWYGCSFGHRVFIDFYPIAAILLGFLLTWLSNIRLLSFLVYGLLLLMIPLNILQSYQHYHSIVPSCDSNKEIYWNNFLSLTPKAKVSHPKENSAKLHFKEKMEENINEDLKDSSISFSGSFSQKIDKNQPFSGAFRYKIDENDQFLLISARLYSHGNEVFPKLVIDIQDSIGNSIEYEAMEIGRYLKKNEWVSGEWGIDIAEKHSGKFLVIYFWLPDQNESFNVDDFEMQVFY